MRRAIIFANGEWIKGTPMPEADSQSVVIAVDGGVRHAHHCRLQPDVLVGDMDSLMQADLQRAERQGARIDTYPTDKDQTDLEIALQTALKTGVEQIDIYGALGKRIDQELANLLLLTLPQFRSVSVRIIGGNQQIWALRGPQEFMLLGSVGDMISIVPLSARVHGLSLKGTAWPLDNKSIRRGSTQTISNRLTAAQATIRLEKGVILIVHISTGDC